MLPLHGPVTPRGSLLYSLLGVDDGGLQAFCSGLRAALADGNVKAIVIDIDSPGGLIDLVPETSAMIRAARGKKPIVAVANTLAASAAYWIAAQADELVVTPSGQVGSIGMVTIHSDFSAMEAMMGINTTVISAGPYKTDGNPYEPLSRDGKAALQDQVDQLYGMFTANVAAGRGVKQRAVRSGYGQGRMVLASDALAAGMVDHVETLEATLSRLGSGAGVRSAGDVDDYLSPDSVRKARTRSDHKPPKNYLLVPRRRGHQASTIAVGYLGEPLNRPPAPPHVQLRTEQPSNVRVTITDTAYQDLIHHAGRRGGALEEGGVAVGHASGLDEVVIVAVGGPGPDSVRRIDSYRPDGIHDYEFIQQMARVYADDSLVAMASWHSHPGGTLLPSQADMEISASKWHGAYDLERFVYRPGWCELIVTPSAKHGFERPDVGAWVTQRHHSVSDWFVCERAELKVRS